MITITTESAYYIFAFLEGVVFFLIVYTLTALRHNAVKSEQSKER